MMGEGAGSKTAAASTAKKPETTEEVHFTNGNWVTGKGCFHTDPHCPALQLATTGIATGPKNDA